MLATSTIHVLLAAAALGCGDHHLRRVEVVAIVSAPNPAVDRELAILRCSPRWRERDNAAHRLAKYSWARNPQMLPALVAALTGDPQDDVRGEAAETLGKLAPCVPEVHEALGFAAARDPKFGVRHQAKKALKSLGKVCAAPCSACDPGVVIEREVIVPGPIEVVPLEPVYELPPGTIEPLPEALPGESPFGSAARRVEPRVVARDRVGRGMILVRRPR